MHADGSFAAYQYRAVFVELTYAIRNNHYLGKATANALEIAFILKRKPVPAPLRLVQRYPDLTGFVVNRGDNK